MVVVHHLLDVPLDSGCLNNAYLGPHVSMRRNRGPQYSELLGCRLAVLF
jgi:hypothetical protein